jgi:alpha-tubulin suppressor-like RCC1 family protein
MNVFSITTALHEKIGSATDLQEILILSKAIEKLNVGHVLVVSTYSEILDLSLADGQLIFVDDENKLYYSIQYKTKIIILPIFSAILGELLYSWGNNTSGKLGDNTITASSSPVSVVGGFTDWIQTSAGLVHSVAVRGNGTAWAWGANSFGQLGDNTSVSKISPVPVVGGIVNWVQASAGNFHSIGLRSDGTMRAWGYGGRGALGHNLSSNSSSPVLVVGGFTDWAQASAGQQHSIGLRSNGSLWAWGFNGNGQLGDNTITNRSSPVLVVGGFTDWTQASAGGSHSLGIRANGTLWAWGANANGRLGDSTVTARSSPVSVVGGFTDWTQASAGDSHSLGVRANGTLWAWGYNGSGGLGDNTTTSRLSPVSVVGGFTDWIQASAGGDGAGTGHSFGIRSNGTAWSWGANSQGQLGNGITTARSSPVSVIGGLTDWVQASAGGTNSIGIVIGKVSVV